MSQTTLPKAVVLGVDTPIGLTVVRELGRNGVAVHGIGRSARALARRSRYMAEFSVRDPGPLAEWLPQRVAETGAGALFAISEHDLIALAPLRAAMPGCRVLTPSAEALDLVLDKARTLALAAELGIETPRSWALRPGDSIPPDIDGITVLKWPDPARVQPALAALGLPLEKAEYCRDRDALRRALDRYADVGEWPLIQAYCPGQGLGQMLHMHEGRATLRFQHLRLHEWPPGGGVSTLCRSLPLADHAEQMERSIALLQRIGWSGPAMVEYRFDPATGRHVLMEVNGRFWGSQPLAYHAGAHFAWEQYRRAVLGATDDAPPPRNDVTARFTVPEVRRLVEVALRRRRIADPLFRATPLRDMLAFAAGCLDPRTRSYVFDWDDPRPFVDDVAAMIRKLIGR